MRLDDSYRANILELKRSQDSINQSIEKLSSGDEAPKIKYDIVTNLLGRNISSQIKSKQAAQINLNNGISMVQVQESGIQNLYELLNQIQDTALNAAKDTVNDDQRSALQTQMKNIKDSWKEVLRQTTFDNHPLINAPQETFVEGNIAPIPSGQSQSINYSSSKDGKIDNLSLMLDFPASENGKSVELSLTAANGKTVASPEIVISGGKIDIENAFGLSRFKNSETDQTFALEIKNLSNTALNINSATLDMNPDGIDLTLSDGTALNIGIFDVNLENIGLGNLDISDSKKSAATVTKVKDAFNIIRDITVEASGSSDTIRKLYQQNQSSESLLGRLRDKTQNVDLAQEKARLVAEQIRQKGSALIANTKMHNPETLLGAMGWGAKNR